MRVLRRIVCKLLTGVFLLIAVAIGSILRSFLRVNPIPENETLSGGAVQIKEGFVSVAAIPSGDHKVILVDCGDDNQATAIIQGLNRMGLNKDDVQAILLTHAHVDHIAGCRVFAHADVYAMTAERPLIERQAKLRKILDISIGTPIMIHVSRYLQNEDSFQIGKQTVVAYLVPGHTAGSAAYLVAGTLYLGDSANAGRDGHLLPSKRFVSENVEENRTSLLRLADELRPKANQIEFMEFAHSGPLRGINALLQFQSKHVNFAKHRQTAPD